MSTCCLSGSDPKPCCGGQDILGSCDSGCLAPCCVTDIEEAARELAEAKRAFAESFLLYRNAGAASTDKQAEAMAEIDHGEKVLLAEARYVIAKRA